MLAKLRDKYSYSLILLKELVRTEFKLRYQGSTLGYLWSLLRPLFLFIILYIVFVYFLKIGSGIPHWPVAMLIGIVLWNFFAEITNNGLTSIVNRGDVIRKINFPKYIIVLSGSISALINLGLNLIVICIFLVINGVTIHWGMLLSPLFMLEIFVFGIGLAFILSSLYVRFRDINYIWEIIMQGLFYASVVIYPLTLVLDKSEKFAVILLFNPVAQAIQDVRHTMISDEYPTLFTLSHNILISLIPILIVGVTILFGAWLFKRRSPSFAEEI